jgi:hypothetical protein
VLPSAPCTSRRAQHVRQVAALCQSESTRDALWDYLSKTEETIDALLDLLLDYQTTLAALNDAVVSLFLSEAPEGTPE